MSDQSDLLNMKQVAKRLGISERTLWRYINANQIEYCILNPLSERRHIRFTDEQVNDFIKKNSRGVQPEQREKRAYHRTKKKYARKKKPVKRGKAA